MYFRHAQLLASDRVLLLIDQGEIYAVYLENVFSIGRALEHERVKKKLYKDKLGGGILSSFDETRRLLVVCSPQKVLKSFCLTSIVPFIRLDQYTLHVFAFDEKFGSLQSWARPFELADWYNNKETIVHICFATGADDIVVVDSGAQARIYSFVSQRFR